MADLNHVVAGLSCREVLARLPDVVDGRLTPERLAQVREHLAGCRQCETFGGDYTALIAAIRRELGGTDAPSPEVAARLRARLRQEFGS